MLAAVGFAFFAPLVVVVLFVGLAGALGAWRAEADRQREVRDELAGRRAERQALTRVAAARRRARLRLGTLETEAPRDDSEILRVERRPRG